MERAYSILATKNFSESDDRIIIEGIATTPTTDRHGDTVNPMGAQFKTPMPLLWQHDHMKPVGHMTMAKPTEEGIPFTAEIPKIVEPGTLKDRIDEAIQSIRYKLVAAVSIGFQPLEWSVNDDYTYNFLSWEWLELSLVTIPANSDALLNTIKSADSPALSAMGLNSRPREFLRKNPGAAGIKTARPVQLLRKY